MYTSSSGPFRGINKQFFAMFVLYFDVVLFWAFLIKQLFHSRLLDMRSL